MDDLVRLACSTDPQEPERRPSRLAIAPRAAIIAGVILIGLALMLAMRAISGATAVPQPSGAPAHAASTASPGPTQEGASAPVLAPPDPGSASAPAVGGNPEGIVVVHVAGAVQAPGVVRLPHGSRVIEAIEAAGGASADADTDQLNLARILSDGEQVRVPRIGETLPEQPAGGDPAGPGATAGASAQQAGGRININTATASQLEELPGIGPALAKRIVEHREAHGPFGAVEDLTDVPGIGQAKMEALKEEATV
ncbi:helix-hairpin-helix domain-containing protein [Actinomyces slackii]|uniref:ComE operon protein 1 n=1 Tax=Actinomyces slackii TaxID=52774 RepID=A0A448KDG0_9ACTO|nr:ComE operon protein 1 [Actinomyces slackii]